MNSWQFAVDHGRVIAHLGVAADGVSKEEAMRQLGELIDWHVTIATDPAVNGGYKLVPVSDEHLQSSCQAAATIRLLADWLDFAKDIRVGCAAGEEWLDILRERSAYIIEANSEFYRVDVK